GPTVVQIPDVGGDRLRAAHRTRPRPDLVGPVLRAALQILAAAELAPLGRRLALDLHDVHREVDRRRVAQARANAESVDARLDQRRDRLLVDGTGHENLHVLVAAKVMFLAGLA